MSVSHPQPSNDGPGASSRPVAEARVVRKAFGPTVAVDGVTMSVLPGDSHALVGRNGAGKSTLVSMLTGLVKPDEGHIVFDGDAAPALSNRAAWRARVACVYQKSTIIPGISVAENLMLNRHSEGAAGLISWRKLYAEAEKILDEWHVDVDPRSPASSLTVEDRQLVEIARSLSLGARFVVLDEPTAQLDKRAIDRLFAHITALQDGGVTFLFISHHLQEVYEICQTVTVLRDARLVFTRPVADVSRTELVEALTGEVGDRVSHMRTQMRDLTDKPVVLEARDLGGHHFSNIDLELREGEVVGLAGIIGSGKVSLAETLAGLRRPSSGEIELSGTPVDLSSPLSAIQAGIGCVPQDRHTEGFVPEMSIAENATMTVARRLTRMGILAPSRVRAEGSRMIGELDIRASGPTQLVSALSGGNQQKVVMARALATDPRILVLINPTAGVDVKSKEALLGLVQEVSSRGRAVIVVSDELDDLRTCDRVVVLFGGRISQILPAGWSDSQLVAAVEGVSVA